MNRKGFSLSEVMMTASNVVIVSILWMFTSIPLLTIGASTSAMYYTIVKVIRKETGTIGKEYFRAFVSNLKQSLLPSFLFVIYLTIMIVDCYNYFQEGKYYTISLGGWIIVLLLLLVFLSYLFAVMSRFQNSFLALLRLSVQMALTNYKTTLLSLLLCFAGLVIAWSYLPIAILVPGVLGYLHSFLFEPIFKKYMPEVKPGSPESELWYNN